MVAPASWQLEQVYGEREAVSPALPSRPHAGPTRFLQNHPGNQRKEAQVWGANGHAGWSSGTPGLACRAGGLSWACELVTTMAVGTSQHLPGASCRPGIVCLWLLAPDSP